MTLDGQLSEAEMPIPSQVYRHGQAQMQALPLFPTLSDNIRNGAVGFYPSFPDAE